MKVAITEQYMTDIANAIRNRIKVTDTYKPSEMAKAIDGIPTNFTYSRVVLAYHGTAATVTGTATKIDDTQNTDIPIITV